ncbi:hypothetical protein [Nocardia coubleae]|uniref:ATP-grasp domain-containing protein n=1 Tax=Nocardia coubleae TaxID=356147 RepID=A0A846WCH4_9NOCA|nr:hypothetical protein [Nocardia coubleae]NKX91212.1 hypothetical protein [Nocardia coubleae]
MTGTALDMTGPRPGAASPVWAVYGTLDPRALTIPDACAAGMTVHQVPTDVLLALETGSPALRAHALERVRVGGQDLIGAVGYDDWWNTALDALNPNWALAAARALVTDKARLYEVLRGHGVAVAPYYTGSLSTRLIQYALDNLGPRPIFKPATGAGSRGVYRYRDELSVEDNLALYRQVLRAGHIDTATPIIATQYLGEHDAAVEISVDVTVCDSRITHAVVHQKCTATATPPYVDGLMICPPTDRRIHAELPQLPQTLAGIVAAIGLADAALHIEARLHLRRWHVLDIGVRPGSGLVAHAATAQTGVDPRLVHLAASIGRPLHPGAVTAARGRYFATAIACCYVTDERRPAITLLRHSSLADELHGSEDVLGWHLNAAETDDALLRPDAGISVGIGAPDMPTALARLRSLVDPFDFTTTHAHADTETVVAQ